MARVNKSQDWDETETGETPTEEETTSETPTEEETPSADAGGSDEEKAKRFRVLALKRLEKSVQDIDKLGKMAGSPHYLYTQDQVEKMFGYLQSKVDSAKRAYETGTTVSEFTF